MAAPQQALSTAIKEEWSLTEEEVALIEASTAHIDRVNNVTSIAAPDAAIVKILVPVAVWGIKEPSKGDLIGSGKGELTVMGVVEMIFKLAKELKQKKGCMATVVKIQMRAKDFVIQCLTNPNDDAYAAWDATSISKEVLSITQDGSTPYEPEHGSLFSQEDNHCQVELALGYCAHRRPRSSFICGYSYLYMSEDELTTAITDSGTPQRINSIRILYANLLANDIKDKLPGQVQLIGSDVVFSDLVE